MYSIESKLLVSSLLLLTVATSLVSSQLLNPQLQLNATVSLSNDDHLLSFTLICHYHSLEKTVEEVRTHRQANVLSFQLNGTTIHPENNYGLTDYREWDFESGAMAEATLPKNDMFIGTFSCKSRTETSSVVQIISLPEKTSITMVAVYATAAVCSVLIIILLVFIFCLYKCSHRRYRPSRKTQKFSESLTLLRLPSNTDRYRSSLTSTVLETGQQQCIPIFPHSKLSSEDAKYVNLLEEVTLDCRGGRYRNEDHDIELHVPEFAVPNGQQITVKIAVSLFCPFKLQDGLRPVSPIVEFCVINDPFFKFTKPIKIVLPHYMTTSSHNDLLFLKAGHGEKEFIQSDGEAVFETGRFYGTLLTNHFSHFCIASAITSPSKANFRMVRITPKTLSPTWRVQYCVTYFLQTCLTSLKNSYNAKHFDVTSLKRFVLSDTQAFLQIHFERQQAGGWLLAQDGGSTKITESEVDFWSLDLQELKQMEEEELYPPRFFIKVNGQQAIDQATAVIRFTGAQEDLETELSLEPFAFQPAPLHTSVSLPNVHRYERGGGQPRYRLPSPAVPSHALLMNYVAAVIPAKWRAVGTQLNVSIGRLDQIEHDHSTADRRFSEVFALWERQSEGTAPYEWSSLYEALRSPQVSENKLANNVELTISATNSNTSLSLDEDDELDG